VARMSLPSVLQEDRGPQTQVVIRRPPIDWRAQTSPRWLHASSLTLEAATRVWPPEKDVPHSATRLRSTFRPARESQQPTDPCAIPRIYGP
jgi:hypothetical protein